MLSHYPGNVVTAAQCLQLAKHYADAAHAFEKLPGKQGGLALAPFRLLAIHAIELTLNALLLHNNVDAGQVRGLQHNLKERLARAEGFGLVLRGKTRQHIHSLGDDREYLVLRYDPELACKVGHLNRLTATLAEVSKKVERLLDRNHCPQNQ